MGEKNLRPLYETFKTLWDPAEKEALRDSLSVKNKGDLWLYNYNNEKLLPKDHHILRYCRGLVISSDGTMLNFPFARFFNHFEDEVDTIDWDSATIIDKIDGSLICVFWNTNKWEITTRGSFYPSDTQSLPFDKIFERLFHSVHLLNKDYCYMFELVSNKNRIITEYDHEAVYLIGMRYLPEFREVTQEVLDIIAKHLDVRRPRTYKLDSVDSCKKLLEGYKDDEEGLVVVDKNFNRMKIKQESYFHLAKIKMLSAQDLFEVVLGLKTIEDEFLKMCPEVTLELKLIAKKWITIHTKIKKIFERIEKITNSRKEFAKEACKYPFSNILFLIKDGKYDPTKLKWEFVKNYFQQRAN